MNKSGISPNSQLNRPLNIGGYEFSILASVGSIPDFEAFHITGLVTAGSLAAH